MLFRGHLPCDVLFIGEAPGESEDSIGVPFIGPAGGMLDSLMFQSYPADGNCIELRRGEVGNAMGRTSYAITNIVACIPRSPVAIGTGELRTPHKEEAAACQPRLSEILHMASPKLVVCLGDIAKRFFAPLIKAKTGGWQGHTLHLIHPSRILRLQEENPNMASLLEKKFVIALSAALRELS